MRRFWLIPIGLVALLIPAAVLAGSGEGGFDGVVHSIEGRYHVRAARIPFLGLVSFISRKATHGGVSNLHVAEIESFNAQVDGDELNQMVTEKLGSGWERIIRDTSRKGNEQTLIFIHPEGDRMGLFVVDKDANEMDVVQVSVDPKHLDDDIGNYRHHHESGHEVDKDSSDKDSDDQDSSDKDSSRGASD
ncbi:MAG: hypothetical protein ABSD67_20735 [Terracidiphilus sp.]|jgi:hypothetical protein